MHGEVNVKQLNGLEYLLCVCSHEYKANAQFVLETFDVYDHFQKLGVPLCDYKEVSLLFQFAENSLCLLEVNIANSNGRHNKLRLSSKL